jgi:hypothetical protein
MSYELLCQPKTSAKGSFRADATSFLTGLDPSLQGPDANASAPDAILEDSFFSGLVSAQTEVVCQEEQLPLRFAVDTQSVQVFIGMGVIGDGAAERVSRALGYVFALAKSFDLKIYDPQQKAELHEANQAATAKHIASYLDKLLDI